MSAAVLFLDKLIMTHYRTLAMVLFKREVRTMTVYIDVLILVNGAVGYFLIKAVQCTCGLQAPVWRVLLAALWAGVSALFILLPPLPWTVSAAAKLLLGVPSAAVAFCPVSRRAFFKSVILYFIFNIILAGTAFAVCWYAGSNMMLVNNATVYFRISPLVLIALSAVLFLLMSLAQRALHIIPQENAVYPFSVIVHDTKLQGNLLIDSGFSAQDAFTDSPVLMLSYPAVKERLSSSLQVALLLYFHQSISQSGDVKLRILPLQTAAGTALLPAVQANAFTLKTNRKTYTAQQLTVVFSREVLGEEFCALGGLNILQKECKNHAK